MDEERVRVTACGDLRPLAVGRKLSSVADVGLPDVAAGSHAVWHELAVKHRSQFVLGT